jgi:hypothetical protein
MYVSAGSALLLALGAGLAALRRRLLSGRNVDRSVTWDCGYAAPTPRMQYTASSFASPLLGSFRLILRPDVQMHAPQGLFPSEASLHTQVKDTFERHAFDPAFRLARTLAIRLHWLQAGPNQLYVLYVAVAILALLVWTLR